ncbi:MAG: hypothetical protein GX900_00115 [Clostridiaceae bacterium]|nr:hypothetical protein [Clostridiaceae bacterium]
MTKFYTDASPQEYLDGIKSSADSWFTMISEAYKMFRLGSFFYLRYKPELRWDRRLLELPQAFGRVHRTERGTEVRYRLYYGVPPYSLIILFLFSLILVASLLYPDIDATSHTADFATAIGIFSLVSVFVLAVASVVTSIYTATTEDGQAGIRKLKSFIHTGGQRYADLDPDELG